jgi:hypothetical protein
MTSDPTLFSQKFALSPNPTIYTADGSRLPVSHIGSISSPNLSVDNTYLVPQLSLNLLSVSQLCELGLELTFSNRDVDVQDPQTGQLIGTGRKIGRLFQLSFLQTPSHLTAESQHSMPLLAYGTLVWVMPLFHVSNFLHLKVI